MSSSTRILKQPLFWIKGILLVISFIIFYFLLINEEIKLFQNNRLTDLDQVNILSIKYLWESVMTINFSILVFVTLLILFIIIHVILLYQDGFEGDKHGH